VEAFIDELAFAAEQDPYAFRRALLQDRPRHLAVLDAVAQRAGWSAPPPPGVKRGIAVHNSYGSYVASVVEVSVSGDRQLQVHRVVIAIDCGIAINPDLVAAQMESSVVFGLTGALFGEITLNKGVVEQSNFHDYPILRMHQTPRIEILVLDSGEFPGGAGEPGVAVIAPALANAVFAATGERIRSLPLKNHFNIV
jgi:isoquinoline 1-oxidoreductase beta subunit